MLTSLRDQTGWRKAGEPRAESSLDGGCRRGWEQRVLGGQRGAGVRAGAHPMGQVLQEQESFKKVSARSDVGLQSKLFQGSIREYS